MRVTEYFNSENALILSGVLAMAAVGALTAFIMQNSSLLPVRSITRAGLRPLMS